MLKSVRFAIADDDELFRKELAHSFSFRPNYKLSFCVGDGIELLKDFRSGQLDFLVIDMHMPLLSGIEAIKIIRKIDDRVPVIAVSTTYQADVHQSLRLLNVPYYSSKDVDTISELADIACNGGRFDFETHYRLWEVQSSVLVQGATRKADHVTDFNAVELRLMSMSYEGYSNKEIADKLNYSPRTVETYIKRLVDKLGLRSKLELIRFASEHGICKSYCNLGLSGTCLKASIF